MTKNIDKVENESCVFSKINSHLLEGLMFHDELYRLFLFLNLDVFAKEHKKRYEEESKSYRKLNKYYITHRNSLIEQQTPDSSNRVIPDDWYEKSRFDILPEDVCNYVSSALVAWVNWERETKELYTDAYNKLIEFGFAAEANYVMNLVKDVDDELAEAESLLIKLEDVKYDIVEIIEMNRKK